MVNFNHERFALAAMSNRYARVCIEEAIKYARVRKTFGYDYLHTHMQAHMRLYPGGHRIRSCAQDLWL